jgi:general secretion pathway protein N
LLTVDRLLLRAGCAIVVLALALVLLAPATWLDRALATRSAGQLRLLEARGGLWHGAGRLQWRSPAGVPIASWPVQWRVRPLPSLRPVLALVLQLDARDVAVELGVGTLTAAPFELALPAEALVALWPHTAALALAGRPRLQVQALAHERGGWRVQASIDWPEARSRHLPGIVLGDYRIEVDAHGGSARARLVTRGGDLELAGEAAWREARLEQAYLRASVAPGVREQLLPLLRETGVERAPGMFEFALPGCPGCTPVAPLEAATAARPSR